MTEPRGRQGFPAGGESQTQVRPPVPVVAGTRGLLGGTFDPVHIGHLTVAEEVRERLGLERIVFVPAAVPPHKPGVGIAPAVHRAAMVNLAIAGNPAFELSDVELSRPGPSYAVDTLAQLTELRDGTGAPLQWTFILSAEALLGLPTWREPRRLLELCRMAVVPRSGLPRPTHAWYEEQFPGLADRFTLLDAPRLDISGTDIRERVAAGRSIRYLVPEPVRDYIVDHALYRAQHRRNA